MALQPFTVLTTTVILCASFVFNLLRCPKHLRGLPRVPLVPTIISFLNGETEDSRTRRLILPTAELHASGIVVMWALGQWYVHVVDHKLGRMLMEHRKIRKQIPPREMLFWRLTGTKNVFFAEGDDWTRHAEAVRGILRDHIPVDIFTIVSRRLLYLLKDGGRIPWNDYCHRFALDVVGLSILGYDFDSLGKPHGALVSQYRNVMRNVSHPLYVGFPALEAILPRRRTRASVDALREEFRRLLDAKKESLGSDYLSLMLSTSVMSDDEYLDNTVIMFMAGHDTTAGALSTVCYFLAKYPEFQDRARAEVMEVLGSTGDPSIASFKDMPFMNACIREALRLNGPSAGTLPRISSEPIILGDHALQPGTPVALNLYGVLHNEASWSSPYEYKPERWLLAHDEEMLAWMPFGNGPRRCPAMNFSVYEQRTLLSMLLREFKWTLPEDSVHNAFIRNAFSTFALLLPENLDLEFTKIAITGK